MTAPRYFADAFGHAIELTSERWRHVLTQHQELEEHEHLVPVTLAGPEAVVRSVYDPQVRLYYKRFSHLWDGKYLVVVVKFNRRHFVLTAYVTDRVKGGVRLWPKG